jgi:N-methylhydantoinase A
MGYMIGVDVGGTFTDFSVFNQEKGSLFHFKHSSTPLDPSQAIVGGIQRVLEMERAETGQVSYLAHGTTVSTNALIEKKGAKLGLITTQGFKDLMEIGRQNRPSLYDLLKQKPKPLIPPGLNCEVPERIRYDGSVETPLDTEAVRGVVRYLKMRGVESVAVCTLFSFINPSHEKQIKEIIDEEYPGVYVTISSGLAPEFREYSRMSTTVLNSYLGPVMKKYVHNFQRAVAEIGVTAEPYVTQSNGSIISIKETIDCPIKTAVSGPSAGVIAGVYVGKQCNADKIITFDMGGTSADISLIENFKPQISNERNVEGFPARIPMINIITIGAGGGSLAQIDEGNALKVGPESAGAVPGPACYNRGGTRPTVTDANIVLGKLNQKKILGGRMDVNIENAYKAMDEHICKNSVLSRSEAANGIISVVNSNMVRAIRSVSVEKGYDVREFTLMAFGGAGPLHACEVAEQIGIRSVLIPSSPGTFCSLGLLMADTKFDLSKTKVMIGCPENLDEINRQFSGLAAAGGEMLDREHVGENRRRFERFIDIRYERQNFEISIPVPEGDFNTEILSRVIGDFHREHKRCYGYSNEKVPVQFINFRTSAVGIIDKPSFKEKPVDPKAPPPSPFETRDVLFQGRKEYLTTLIYHRENFSPGCTIKGPAIVEQMDTTVVIPPDWVLKTDGFDNLRLTWEVR